MACESHFLDSGAKRGCEHELILFLDGAGDELEEHARTIKDERVLVMFSATNLGVAVALNRAFEASSGELVARIDSDDYSLPGRYRTQMQAFQRLGVDVLGSAAVRWNENLYCAPRCLDTAGAKAAVKLGVCPIFHPTAMFRRSSLQRLGARPYPDFTSPTPKTLACML